MRKLHKMILSLYIVLLMSLSMFCIHCKAYVSGDTTKIHCVLGGSNRPSGNNDITGQIDYDFSFGNRTIIMAGDKVIDELGVSSNAIVSERIISGGFVVFSNTQNAWSWITSNATNISPGWVEPYVYNTDGSANLRITNLTKSFDEYFNTEYFHATYFYGSYNLPTQTTIIEKSYEMEVQYVETLNDVKKYLQGDNSVVKNGDPTNNEIVDENGNIPTPQGVKLYNDGQCVGLVWDNPKMINKLVGKYGDVSVEIKFRPTLNYNLDLFRSKTLTPTEYIGGLTTSLSDHGSLYNGFMTLFSNRSTVSNKLDKYNIKFDNHYIFTDNILDSDYANLVCKMLGHKLWYVPDSLLDAVLPARGGSLPANTLAGEMIDKKSNGVKAGEGGSAVDVGLKVLDSLGNLSDFVTNTKELMNNVTVGHSDYMIRYYMMDGNKKICSKWVNVNQSYDDNSSATDEQSTNFKDVENNPVDNPNYNYPSSTSSSSSTGDSWWTHFDDSTKTVFDSLSEQMEQLTESDGGFMQFFGELFSTFPWLAGIFMLALSIALFLRIFGR